MANRSDHKFNWFTGVPTKVFLIIFIVATITSVFALRANNQHMVQLREAVYEADKNGQGVEPALNNLRAYVYGHMNTNLASGGNAIKPPIQLKYTYERLSGDALAQAQEANLQVYTDAQNYCQSLNSTDFSGRNRVPCVTNYVTNHGVKVTPIPAALYQFDFLSPAWSPDFAGWSLVIAILAFIALVISFLSRRIIRNKG